MAKKQKIVYPRTPRRLWASVKIQTSEYPKIRRMRKEGMSFTKIGNEYGVSKTCIYRILTPEFVAQQLAWQNDHPEARIMTPEQRREGWLRKKKYCGKKIKKYYEKYRKSYKRKR